ncbi:MAG: DNA topoisomerase [Leptospirillum sp.]
MTGVSSGKNKMMRLFIAEKPSLARAIAEAIGNPVKTRTHIDCGTDRVTWCIGHIMEQAPPEAYGKEFAPPWDLRPLPVLPEKWLVLPVEPLPNPFGKDSITEQNRFRKGIFEHFEAIERLIMDPSVTEIVNAGDPDREGQLIVDEILEYLNVKKKVLRIWLKALDPETIKKAIRDLEDNDLPKFRGLKNSALARSRADWLVGMNMTRAITSIAGSRTGDKTVWSVGRVQTPVLRLVHERNEEIDKFKPKDFFVPVLTVETVKGLSVDLEWSEREIPGVTDEEKHILSRADAEKIVQGARGKSFPLEVKKETKSVAAPLPWSLSCLQVFAGKEFGMNPKKVLETVQTLYDNGFVSYPRTDCEYLPESIHPAAAKIIPSLSAAFSIGKGCLSPSQKSKAFNDSKVTAHYAITPTVKIPSLGSLSPGERSIYEAIVRVYMAQFAPPLSLSETKIGLKNSPESFSVSGKIIQSKGWTEIWPHGGPKNDKVLPSIDNFDSGKVTEGSVRGGKTTPPKPFTESGIIEVMKSVHKYVSDKQAKAVLKESDGIGTEATRAEIVNILIVRDLLQKASCKGKDPALLVTEKGVHLLKSVPSEVSNPVLTATWERALSEIASIGKGPDGFVDEVSAKVSKWISDLKDAFGTMDMGNAFKQTAQFSCPSCGRPQSRIKGPSGFFWGCTGYRDTEKPCKTTCPDERGKPGKSKVSGTEPEEPTRVPCKKCGKNLVRRMTGTKKPFLRCVPCSASFWPEGSGVGAEWAPFPVKGKSDTEKSKAAGAPPAKKRGVR